MLKQVVTARIYVVAGVALVLQFLSVNRLDVAGDAVLSCEAFAALVTLVRL